MNKNINENNVVLEMRNVTKRFPGVTALKDVSLKLYKGETLAICGENGAGKSTLMKVLSGSYTGKTYDGEIWLEGKKVENASVSVMEKCGIQMVYQEMNIMLDASIAENIFVGNLPIKNGFVNYKKLYADTRNIMEEIGLPIDPKEKCRSLNSGQLQMISIMRALSRNPKIMVLDEPTSALTDQETEILMNYLRDLRSRGISCIFITHKLDEIFQIADRVVVMRDGEFVSSKCINDVTKESLVEEMVGRKIENL